MTAAPIKVAVIGGGCAAIAAAFELSRPEHGGRYAVTVYQMGWRLGGKGASGRGLAGRIEEHGLHVWMGWYENAFRLLRECYTELGRNWRTAFEPASIIAVAERTSAGRWEAWSRLFPPAEGMPGDPLRATEPWTVARYLVRTTALLRGLIAGLDSGAAAASRPPDATSSGSTLDQIVRMSRYGEIATLAGIAQAVATLEAGLRSVGQYPVGALLQFL